MEGNENISEELRSISALVAEISRETPYAVPDGYWEGLAGLVLDRVRTPVYSVPEGYFEGFAAKLMNRIRSGQEAEGPGKSGSENKTARLEGAALSPREELVFLSPLLSGIDQKMPFELPQGYFEELSPLLAVCKDKPLYQVPEGYFETISDTLLSRVTAPAPARVILMGRKMNWLKYAAAAILTGALVTGGWLKLHTSGTKDGVDIAQTLPTVSDQDIENYLDTNNVTNNFPSADELSTASLEITENDGKSLFGNVPDGELQQYLEEHGDEKSLATN